MVKNVRWLYNKLGTDDFSTTGSDTVTGALSNLQSGLNGKANSSHSHTTDTLPVSNNQVNSVNYIPTSALLYSMSMRAEGIQSVVGIAKRELDDPNKRYESKSLGTWRSASDVDTFLSTYTHENNYEGLSLGNYVTIKDGTYNVAWKIAGFDMEHGQLAADGTVYDNGYGICLIPKTELGDSLVWGNSYNTVSGAYKSSRIHEYGLPAMVTNLKNVLGSHIVSRNVLLSDNIAGEGQKVSSSSYTWTTSHATLMSVGQMTGTFASHNNKYDDGEANYKLPLFNYESYVFGYNNVWTRNIYYISGVWVIMGSGSLSNLSPNTTGTTRPLIYIR